MIESINEVARQINPELWDRPESEEPNVRVVHTIYEDKDKDNHIVVGLDSVTIKIPGREDYTYANKKPGTPYQPLAVYRLRTIFLNSTRNTMTIAFEDVNEQLQFATWRTPFSQKERNLILFKPVAAQTYR